ncbi:MAG TPA: hypothetical protein VIL42_09935 [Sphingomicrobium sp.]|jgi:hypothetical protein
MSGLRRIAVLLAVLLSLTAAPAFAQPASKGLQLVDYTDEFARVWEATASLPDAERTARFKSEFAKILPGFYDHRRMRGATEEKYDAHLLKGLKAYPEQRQGITRVAREFAASMAPSQASFERAFGPMTGYPPVLLVNSLGEFDGGTRTLEGKGYLMFGADMIDKLYKTTPIQPFFHHELFHLYHSRSFDECEAVWCGLWSEGLAVYVAAQLNPGADDASLLLTFPVSLREAVEKDRRGAVCSIATKLDSTANEDLAAMFQGRPNPDGAFPPRYAYYVGYLVAQDVGRTRTLKQLASLTLNQARPLIEASLAQMASCPTGKASGGERG